MRFAFCGDEYRTLSSSENSPGMKSHMVKMPLHGIFSYIEFKTYLFDMGPFILKSALPITLNLTLNPDTNSNLKELLIRLQLQLFEVKI
jgi:hypothetical protein